MLNITNNPTLGRYQLISLIGRGGMAEVHKAYQPGLDRYVAIKVLHPHIADDPGFIERFEREAASVARLRHPNIVQVIDFDCQDGRYYMVMEFIEGASLNAELERRAEIAEPYTSIEATNLISGIASALDYAHGRGMLHRDIKPGNILFTREGQVVLADFGIAHIIGTTLYTESVGLLGTPAYLSPEQCRGEVGDTRSDIYSLGVVLYQILVGCLPYEAETPLGLIQQHIEAPLPPPRQLNPDLPEAVEVVILKALAKDPEERFQRAGEMALALLEAAGLEPDQVIGIAALPMILETPARLEISKKPLPACPYQGLFAFKEEDAPFFFGREDFTDQLIAAVEARSLVAVVGPSGSGKSSVVYAGLLPYLRQAASLRGSQERAWMIADLRVGEDPFYNLANALLPLLETQLSKTDELLETRKLAAALAKGEVLLRDAIGKILNNSPEHGRLLLVIDQLEELYTLCTQPDTQRRFVETLLLGLESASSLNLVLTLRSDFLSEAFSLRPFADALQDANLILGPMTQGEFVQAIENPARKQGVLFEAGLVERILDDIGDEPGNLPLLEFALTQLWEEQKTGQLTHAAYEAIGRVGGALARYADQVYAGFDPSQQERAHHIFTQLVRPGEGALDTRRLALRRELGENNWELVQKLADTRLVVTGSDAAEGQETVEVVHEALITGWGKLREWMNEARAFRTWQDRLRAAMHQWETSARDEGALLHGAPLAEAESWLGEKPEMLIETEIEFIQASLDSRERQKMNRERRRRVTILALAGGLIIALILAFWANSQRIRAIEAEQDALRSASIGLALRAESEITGLYPEIAVPLALEVLENYPYTWQAERALGNAVMGNRLQLILQHDEEINLALWSPDGARILTASDDNTAVIWDSATGEALHTLSGHTEDVTLAEWSPNGGLVLTAGPDGSARLWESSSGKEQFTLSMGEDKPGADPVPITAVAFSPDGGAIAAGSADGNAKVWEIKIVNNEVLIEELFPLSGHVTSITGIAWSPDGSRILTSCITNPHKVWDALTGAPKYDVAAGRSAASGGRPVNHYVSANESAWSPDGKRIYMSFWNDAGISGFVQVRGVLSEDMGELILRLPPTNNFPYYQDMQLGPDGARLATFGSDELIVWNAITGEEIHRLVESFQPGVFDWSPEGTRFVTASPTGEINIWDAYRGVQHLSISGHRGAITSLDWSPIGERILSSSVDGTARVWYVEKAPLTLRGPDSVMCADWSPQRDTIGIAYANGPVVLYDAATGEMIIDIFEGSLMAEGTVGGGTCQLALSPEDKRFVIVSGGLPKLWDLRDTEHSVFLIGHTDIVDGVAWSPDGGRIATSSRDGTLRIWDGYTGEELLAIPTGLNEGIFDLNWSLDGKQLLLANFHEGEGSIRVIDPDSGEVLSEYHLETCHTSVAKWAPDREQIALFCDDQHIQIWRAPFEEQPVTIGQDIFMVGNPTWSASGKRILAGSQDGLVKMWEVGTGEELLNLEFDGQVEVLLSSNGKKVGVVQLSEGTVSIFPMWETLEELQEYARECCLHHQLTLEERLLYGLHDR